MIDLPPAGGRIRTRDLVVESRRVQDHWALPVIPSKWYPKYPLVQKQIGFGGSGPFCTFFDIVVDPKNVDFGKKYVFESLKENYETIERP